MKYFYFFLVGLVGLGLLYNIVGISYFKWAYYQANTPKADFQVIKGQDNNLTIVDFTNYRCGYCKQAHPLISEALKLHKDVRYIVRPIELGKDPDAEITQQPNDLVKLAMAAGMQGKFKAMHDSFMEYPENIIPEDVIKETAALYGIDYDKMIEDSKGKIVQKYLDDNVQDMLSINIKTIPSYLIHKNIYAIREDMPELKDFLTMITNEKK